MYDQKTKVATDTVDVAKLLDATVIANGQLVKLRTEISGKATLLLFVRNGA